MSNPFPNRPTHPDFERLTKLIIETDEHADGEPNYNMGEYISRFIDSGTLVYVAKERSKMIMAAQGINIRTPLDAEMGTFLMVMLSAALVEGFTLGVQFEQGRP